MSSKPDVLVVPAMPLHGVPAVPLAEAVSSPGLRGYELLRKAWPAARVALAVVQAEVACTSPGTDLPRQARLSGVMDSIDQAAVRELGALIGAQEVWEMSAGSGSFLLEALAHEAGGRMGPDTRLAVSSPWCVLTGDARAAAESALVRFGSGAEATATCREVEPHPSAYRLVRSPDGTFAAWRAYAYAGAFSYSPRHGGFIDPQEKPLFRRQDFPPLYELDYGLAAGTVAGLASLRSRMEEQPGVLVPSHDSILLMGLLDVARAEALESR